MAALLGKRAVVVGLGKSGVAACRLLASRGATVVATDAKTADQISAEVRALEEDGIRLALGGHGKAGLAEADLVVVSPGVPGFPELAAAERAGVPIWGEVELAVRSLTHPAPVLAIGGTNGKSTTTELCGAILRAAGKRTFVGGNLGEPLAAHASEIFDVIVLEVSSFQLERVDALRPRVSVLLNVSADHLDRYEGLEAYARAKGNAFVRQTEDDLAVVPFGDEVCFAQARRGRAAIMTFGPGGDVDVTGDAIVDRARGLRIARDDLALSGLHNAMNVAAAIAATAPFDVPAEAYARALREFRGLPHRMALVAEVGGVRFYDDSKGTNVGAAVTAVLGTREKRVVLIAGGRDKGGSYGPLASALREKGRAAVLIGEAAGAIAEALGDAVPSHRASSMEEAVRVAAGVAHPGDAVLLSPACSSFDMFKDYRKRGEAFDAAVQALASEGGPR
jgi:UDP-N-acetylmuramoylalanine--D-glutamate ligase